MLCTKFGWNWSCGSGEGVFFNFVSLFLLFYVLFETNLSPLYRRMTCAKFGWYYWKFLSMYYLPFRDYLPLENGSAPFFEQIKIPSPNKVFCKNVAPLFEQTWIQGCFVPSIVEIDPVVVEKRILKMSSMYFLYFIKISLW